LGTLTSKKSFSDWCTSQNEVGFFAPVFGGGEGENHVFALGNVPTCGLVGIKVRGAVIGLGVAAELGGVICKRTWRYDAVHGSLTASIEKTGRRCLFVKTEDRGLDWSKGGENGVGCWCCRSLWWWPARKVSAGRKQRPVVI